jgi:hypothetical protein
MNVQVLDRYDVDIENEFIHDGVLRVRPFANWMQYSRASQMDFLNAYGLYCLPTCELIEFLMPRLLAPSIVIGDGALGRALKIPSKIDITPLGISRETSVVSTHWPATAFSEILRRVRRYIMIGNLETHRSQPILRTAHEEIRLPELVTRSHYQALNRIFIWDQRPGPR